MRKSISMCGSRGNVESVVELNRNLAAILAGVATGGAQ